MFCVNCGYKNEDGSQFCNRCGSRIGYQSQPQFQDNMLYQNNRPVQKSVNVGVVIAIVSVIVVLIGAGGALLVFTDNPIRSALQSRSDESNETVKQPEHDIAESPSIVEKSEDNKVVIPEDVDQILAQMEDDDKAQVGSYNATMNTDWEFDNGSAISTNAYIENDVTNRNTVYLTIELDEDPGELIYTSPYIEVGGVLKNIRLDKALQAGRYNTTATYHLVDEDFQELSSVSVNLNIIVKN